MIAAGIEEFAENGFAATRLSDVAKRAGVVKGTIYRYFDSKEDLFEQAVISSIRPIIDHAESMSADYQGRSEDLLRMILTFAYAQIVDTDVKSMLRIFISEGQRFPSITEFYYREIISKGLNLLRGIAQRGIERGEFRKGALTDLPMMIMGPTVFAAVWKLTFNQYHDVPTEAFLNAHLDMVLNGLKVRPG